VLECDTVAVADAVLGGIHLSVQMLADHMTDKYEGALGALSAGLRENCGAPSTPSE
jgi:hypothetical protein